MKKILTKVGYMVFGCLLTVIGYHFGNIDNNSADAQLAVEKSVPIVDEIRCRSLVIVGDDDTPRIYIGTDLYDLGYIQIYNKDVTPRVSLGVANNLDAGLLHLDGKESGGTAVILGADKHGGFMTLFNKVIDKACLQAGITDKGNGFIATFDKTGSLTNDMGPKGPSAGGFRQIIRK